MLDYYKLLLESFWGGVKAATVEQVIGAFLAVSILVFQVRYGIIHSAEVRTSYWAIAWPYIILICVLFAWHLLRAPYRVHNDTIKRVSEKVEREHAEKELRPDFRPSIAYAIKDIMCNEGLFVRLYIVNLSNANATVKRVTLVNHTTGEELIATPFGKCFKYRDGSHHFTDSFSEDQVRTKTMSGIKDEVVDVLNDLRDNPLVKGTGRGGWLLFRKKFGLADKDNPSLSLRIEDAFGGIHEGDITSDPCDYGMFSA